MDEPGYRHYAMTIQDGDVSVYFDGEEVIADFVGNGYSNDVVNSHIGEGSHNGGGTADEQLIGSFGEVLERAVSARDISLLADGNANREVRIDTAESRFHRSDETRSRWPAN